MTITKSLGNNVYQVCLIPESKVYTTTGYIILGEHQKVIIEPGASPENLIWLKAFEELNIKPEQIDAIIATHIHLDHSGGAGGLMQHCPNAIMMVHEKGAPHLIDPEKLVAGSRSVYGDSFDQFFEPVLPIPAERVKIQKEGDIFSIGTHQELRFYNAPGHAMHHLFIFDTLSQGIFSGDSAGLFYSALYEKYKVKVALPSSTPTQFDPESMTRTLDQMLALDPQKIYYTHFGMAEPAVELINTTKSWLDIFGKDCLAFYESNPNLEALSEFLHSSILDELEKQGVPRDCSSLNNMKQDNHINALGIISYIERLKRAQSKK
jgi:glyoxylase-like metal-dependent hydrolase (beta-lactamase superfamily II)